MATKSTQKQPSRRPEQVKNPYLDAQLMPAELLKSILCELWEVRRCLEQKNSTN